MPLDFDATDSITTLFEQETRTTGYTPSRLPGIEVAIGGELRRNLLLSGSIVGAFGRGTANVSAEIPHPILYARPRSLTGEVTSERIDTAIHIVVGRVLHRSAGYELIVGAGPSFFIVKQQLLDRLEYDETYPYDEVRFTGATVARHMAQAFGANGEVDFVKPFSRTAALQVTARYSYGLAKFDVGDSRIESETGQAQISGGLRLAF
jgi:hypothetical protein